MTLALYSLNSAACLFEFVQVWCNRSDILAVWNDLAFKLDTGVSTHLAFEVRAVHLLALRAVTDADAQEIKATHQILVAWEVRYKTESVH